MASFQIKVLILDRSPQIILK